MTVVGAPDVIEIFEHFSLNAIGYTTVPHESKHRDGYGDGDGDGDGDGF